MAKTVVKAPAPSKVLQWKVSVLAYGDHTFGKMAPGRYHECYSDLNEHGLFMERYGKRVETKL
jgi:hypothetical protein